MLPSGLQYRVLTRSMNLDGVTPNISSLCHVHYRGTTIKGIEFDSSYKRGKPTKFRPSDVIKGWAEALQVRCPAASSASLCPSACLGDGNCMRVRRERCSCVQTASMEAICRQNRAGLTASSRSYTSPTHSMTADA